MHDAVDDALHGWRELGADHGSVAAVAVGLRLLRTATSLRRTLDRHSQALGLAGRGDYEVIAALRRSSESASVGHLASTLMLSTAGMSGRLDRLERLGLVARERSGADGRSTLVRLTENGERVTDELFGSTVQTYKHMLSGIAAKDRAVVEDALRQMGASLSNEALS